MSIQEQAVLLGRPIIGSLTRDADREKSRQDQFFHDDAGNRFHVRHGILTVVSNMGESERKEGKSYA
ncbi:MAG: hypothetical protein IJI27_05435 [Oscillospiraceae bacterium]|nr:hypothetical protein [Oscillospiraceae bacterium]